MCGLHMAWDVCLGCKSSPQILHSSLLTSTHVYKEVGERLRHENDPASLMEMQGSQLKDLGSGVGVRSLIFTAETCCELCAMGHL